MVDVASAAASPARMRAANQAYGAAGFNLTSSFSQSFRLDWMAWSSKYFCSSAVLAALWREKWLGGLVGWAGGNWGDGALVLRRPCSGGDRAGGAQWAVVRRLRRVIPWLGDACACATTSPRNRYIVSCLFLDTICSRELLSKNSCCFKTHTAHTTSACN